MICILSGPVAEFAGLLEVAQNVQRGTALKQHRCLNKEMKEVPTRGSFAVGVFPVEEVKPSSQQPRIPRRKIAMRGVKPHRLSTPVDRQPAARALENLTVVWM